MRRVTNIYKGKEVDGNQVFQVSIVEETNLPESSESKSNTQQSWLPWMFLQLFNLTNGEFVLKMEQKCHQKFSPVC